MQLEGSFTAPDRHMGDEDEIVLTSVGVDIGSSTSHLLFSRLTLERQSARYVTSKREVIYQSDILLTPYTDTVTIDGDKLSGFIESEYQRAGLRRADVDTGALILTGVALRRRNARAIADLFAAEAGRFVAVSAGDNLEAMMAAHGSGAVELSIDHGCVLNVDIGGGTTKVVLCRHGEIAEVAALDIGARLVAFDAGGTMIRVEAPGVRLAAEIGLDLALGATLGEPDRAALVEHMVDELFVEIGAGSPDAHSRTLRTEPIGDRTDVAAITFSGGVSEFLYSRAAQGADFGDLGRLLGERIWVRREALGAPVLTARSGIRATVIGASQHTIQVSGSTIYLSAPEMLPIRNLPVVVPAIVWDGVLEPAHVRDAVRNALTLFDLAESKHPIAVAVSWGGSATFARLQAFCTGLLEGLDTYLARDNPLVIVCDGDVGGLLGLHLRHEIGLDLPIACIDGIELRSFDYVDIGSLIPSSGAVPVVIKSLIFTAEAPTHLAAREGGA